MTTSTIVENVNRQMAAGASMSVACFRSGISQATFRRMAEHAEVGDQRSEVGGQRSEVGGRISEVRPQTSDLGPLIAPAARIGRPPMVEVAEPEAASLRRLYVQTNRCRGKGSMTMAARMYAKDPATRPALSAAILAPRASKHALPVEVRRAMRGLDTAVTHHRDPDALALGGIYTPGGLRMVRDADGSLRRLEAGERQSWDDASINFPICVPWPWGGDKCSDRYKVRIGRFQLLACVDDATDFCPGFSYTIRDRDSYRAEDIVAAMYRVWSATYAPKYGMLEGGGWQSARALEFMRRAGVYVESAKGRPHSKLVESFWNRLWTVLSVYGGHQIGRFRGEMAKENDLWIDCQQGRKDPRQYFLMLPDALNAITQAIGYLNTEQVESRLYGKWVPAEMHAAGIAGKTMRQLPQDADLACLAWPVYAKAKVTRGMVRTTAVTPAGGTRPYHFCGAELYAWNGAPVRVSFDPWGNPPCATVTLDAPFQDARAGTVIARGLECMDDCAVVSQSNSGAWGVAFLDGHAAAERAKKLANGTVRREVRILGLDGRSLRVAQAEARTPEGGDQMSEVGSRRSEVGSRKSEVSPIRSRWQMLDDDAATAKAG